MNETMKQQNEKKIQAFGEYIYDAAVQRFGKSAQVDMAIEECSELIQALCKFKRYEDVDEVRDNIVEEITDVEIMIAQMKIIFDGDYESEKRHKLERLNRLICVEE